MSVAKKVMSGCVLLPIMLVGGCFGKMSFDSWRYNLPGEVLRSPLKPTHTLEAPMQVAEALDAYVQPRFEILRDKNFGAFRIVYRKHAGIVQLKVDTPQEQEAIANINATHRDYIIGLLHCAPLPDRYSAPDPPKLQLLYFNQKPLAKASTYHYGLDKQAAEENHFDMATIEAEAIKVKPQLLAGKEHRTGDDEWTVLMRPVRASNQECLSCHNGAKPGATLGVMVYAVRKTRNDVATKIGMR